jgi:hypothetical protein
MPYPSLSPSQAPPDDAVPTPAEPTWGDTLKSAMWTYGPIVAAAIPAIMLARGSGGKELGNLLKRFAPKHFAEAQRSPFPYLLDTEATAAASKMGPFYSTLRDRPPGPPTVWEQIFDMSGKPRVDPKPLFDYVQGQTGARPTHMGYLSVAPGPKQGDLTSSAMHEFGHLSGFNRVQSQYPSGSPQISHMLGAGHLDILHEPRTEAILKSGMQNPDLRDYFARRLSGAGSPPHGSLGELLTELWAKRMIERGGGRYVPIESAAGTSNRVDPITSNRLNAVAQTGQLAGDDRTQQMQALGDLLRILQGSQRAMNPPPKWKP